MTTALLIATLLAATPAPLAPMDFLAGRCFTGPVSDDARSLDTHCFRRIHGDHFLRDEHVVCTGDEAVYSGETTYGVEPGTDRVQWRYLSVMGLVMDGYVKPEGDALVFTSRYLRSGTPLDVRVTWTRIDKGYRAKTMERVADGEWKFATEYDFVESAPASCRP